MIAKSGDPLRKDAIEVGFNASSDRVRIRAPESGERPKLKSHCSLLIREMEESSKRNGEILISFFSGRILEDVKMKQ